MIDTAHLAITRHEAGVTNFVTEIAPRLNLERVTIETSPEGFERVRGRLENLTVVIAPDRLSVTNGSLCKWMIGDNYRAMTPREIRDAIDNLSDALLTPMDRAKVFRLDFGTTLPIKEPIENCFNRLGTASRLRRMAQPEGLYYGTPTGAHQLAFYDKNREQRLNRLPIPIDFAGCNALRYEYRIKKNPSKVLQLPECRAGQLCDEVLLKRLLDIWLKGYNSISKINDIELPAMTGVTELNKIAFLHFIEMSGGEIALLARINEAQRRGECDKVNAKKMRDKIKRVCTMSGGATAIPSTTVAEMNARITEFAEGYL